QSSCSFSATSLRSFLFFARRQVFGRFAAIQARSSARAARYLERPLFRAISRLTVEGARFSSAAISRTDSPSTSRREISSRSASVRAQQARLLTYGVTPPLEASTPCIEPDCFPSARPISLIDCPILHRDQSSCF